MGAWGTGIRQDDTVCDVIGAFEDALKNGADIAGATAVVHQVFAEAILDPDDGPHFWLALADAQWTYGQLDPTVLGKVCDHIRVDVDLSAWKEATKRDRAKRRAVLDSFLQKINAPNPKPKKYPKRVVRNPRFAAGDCLSIQLPNGHFGAAIVLAENRVNPEYGKNLIGVLDYMSTQMPTLPDFSLRKWLILTHHQHHGRLDLLWYLPVGFRAEKNRFEIIGRIDVLSSDPSDPTESLGSTSWHNLGRQIVYQREWDDAPASS